MEQFVPGKYYLIDSIITRFDIYYKNYLLNIDIYFSLAHDEFDFKTNLKLHFIGVKEYEFYWNEQYNFYTVERYKFIKTEKGYYISLDPYDESDEISDADHDIILCNEVEGYFL